MLNALLIYGTNKIKLVQFLRKIDPLFYSLKLTQTGEQIHRIVPGSGDGSSEFLMSVAPSSSSFSWLYVVE
jgi:hypothetical protein